MSPSQAQASGASARTSFQSGCGRLGRLQEPRASVNVVAGAVTSASMAETRDGQRGCDEAPKSRGAAACEQPPSAQVSPSFSASLRAKEGMRNSRLKTAYQSHA